MWLEVIALGGKKKDPSYDDGDVELVESLDPDLID